MSNYYSKGVVNRYWKRPKPRVYECNIRDAERFYQQSYKDYTEAKESAAKRASDEITRPSDDSSPRWEIRRSHSLLDSDSTNALDSSGRSSFANSSSSSKYGNDSSSTNSTFRTASSINSTTDGEMASIEDRLQRIQKLRVELGLPESNGTSGTNSKVTFLTPTSPTSTIGNRQLSPDIRERRGRTIEASSLSSSSAGSRSRAVDLSSDSHRNQLSSDTERSSRFASKYNNNDDSYNASSLTSRQNGRASSYSREEPESKYSLKSSLKKERRFEANDSDYSYKPSASKSSDAASVSFKSSRKPVAPLNDDDDCDADAFLSSIKKKFPTSDEILERIKKMDSDM